MKQNIFSVFLLTFADNSIYVGMTSRLRANDAAKQVVYRAKNQIKENTPFTYPLIDHLRSQPHLTSDFNTEVRATFSTQDDAKEYFNLTLDDLITNEYNVLTVSHKTRYLYYESVNLRT